MRRIVLPLVALVVGCGLDLPEEADIEDARILAIRAVAEDAASEVATPASFEATDVLRFETLFVDPDGELAAPQVLWLACAAGPEQSGFSCLEPRLPLESDVVRPCDEQAGEVCVLAEGPNPSFSLPTFESLADDFDLGVVAVLSLDGDVPRCVDALLGGEFDTPESCRYAAHTVDVLNARVADANQHPAALEVDVSVGTEAAVSMVRGEVLVVDADAAVHLAPRLRDEDEETFSVPVNNGGSFQDAQEELRVRWFRVGGDFEAYDGPPTDADAELQSTTWTDGGDDDGRIYAILRDGRGGLSWWWIDLEVRR